MNSAYTNNDNLLHYATITASLLNCINQIAVEKDNSLAFYLSDLVFLASERANTLVTMLDMGKEGQHV
ncbi:hypothetical protein [Arsenophonus nasoniae]|uniref:Uncharacterized protein n=1 Tax=Arsenophonus nasoniae TaxID=638 RepID=A0AA95GJQ2_9GAMM|nr:hypothetical protein [Arsenophonus nasoniae]WGM00014.1 hypothetical protein QE210_08845 [Arsenophonus nasoniae]WGM00207.1 hypothetical protein QE210_09910 [Arsenophonus nasoniae]